MLFSATQKKIAFMLAAILLAGLAYRSIASRSSDQSSSETGELAVDELPTNVQQDASATLPAGNATLARPVGGGLAGTTAKKLGSTSVVLPEKPDREILQEVEGMLTTENSPLYSRKLAQWNDGFRAEDRDEEWARKAEAALRRVIAQVQYTNKIKLGELLVECRTTLCMIRAVQYGQEGGQEWLSMLDRIVTGQLDMSVLGTNSTATPYGATVFYKYLVR